jgi:NADH-quinone oxidoreductase subunit N
MILSLAGIPLTAGFLGKFYVLAAGASAAAWALVIVLIVSSTVGLVYYLRIIVAMFMESERSGTESERETVGIAPGVVLAVLTTALFVLGIYPGPFWDTIRAASAGLGSSDLQTSDTDRRKCNALDVRWSLPAT